MDERIAKALELHYRADRKWRPIPLWARFFISLGASMRHARSSGRRVVTALSVPTASFAAAFVSLGRVLAEPIAEPASEAIEKHFEKLSALPLHTRLMFIDGEALFHGPFLGVHTINGQEFLRIDIRGVKRFVPKQRSLLVELEPDREQPRPEGAVAGRLRGPKAFVSSFYSQMEHYRLCCSTEKCVTVLGAVNRFRSELVQTQFAMKSDAGNYDGVLQDLVRVGKFATGGLGYRTGIYAGSKGRPQRDSVKTNALVIFDGATPFLRWAHQDTCSDSIVILERTDPSFSDGVSAANARYLSRLDDFTLSGLLAPPPGIDLMVHVEAAK